MTRVGCAECHQSFPMNDTAKIDGRPLCRDCATAGKLDPASLVKQIDPTVCCGCRADFGSSALPTLQSGLPVCSACEQAFLHRPYPSWVKLSFGALVAVALVSLVVNWRFTAAYIDMRSATREMQAGKVRSAASLMRSASVHAPESADLRDAAGFYQGLYLLAADKSAEALPYLQEWNSRHPAPQSAEFDSAGGDRGCLRPQRFRHVPRQVARAFGSASYRSHERGRRLIRLGVRICGYRRSIVQNSIAHDARQGEIDGGRAILWDERVRGAHPLPACNSRSAESRRVQEAVPEWLERERAMIPGILITLLTFPGVIVHEAAHMLFCRLRRVAVFDACFFRIGNPAGYVIHEGVQDFTSMFLISMGPFIVNSIICIFFCLPAMIPVRVFGHTSLLSYFLLWVGLSIGMNAFPSTQDANVLWRSARRSAALKNPLAIVSFPLVVLLYVANILRFFWLDYAYGVAIGLVLPEMILTKLR
jgi:hypothetical protein